VTALELGRAELAESRVPAMGVVPPLDPLEEAGLGRRRCRKAVTVQDLALQGGEEALAQGVVVAVAGTAQ
jgi:hypothetical protein